MPLSDTRIKELMAAGVLSGASDKGIGPVSYDLTVKEYCTADGAVNHVELEPGDSVFVASNEVIRLPDDLTAEVRLRNSRIRQGLTLDAPLYFPGHHTRVFYRVTNVGAEAIDLDVSSGIAQLTFSPVEGKVAEPYHGSFADELDYRGLGRYEAAIPKACAK